MDTEDYSGKGLSLPQLVFALNEELKHAVQTHSPLYVARSIIVGQTNTLTRSTASPWMIFVGSTGAYQPRR